LLEAEDPELHRPGLTGARPNRQRGALPLEGTRS
jgi:hypothetical protein